MKKVLSGVLAGVLAAVMCASFAACGEKEIDAESIEGKEVTEAQWIAAFDELVREDAVYTVRGEVVHKTTATEKEQTASATLKYFGFAVENGKREHSKIEQKIVGYSGDVKEVFHLSGGVIEGNTQGDKTLEYYFEFHDRELDYYENGWDTDTWTYYPDAMNTSVRSFIFLFVSTCKENFALFHYDSEKKGYVASEEIVSDKNLNSGYLPYATIKFDENGKIVALCGEAEFDGYDIDRHSNGVKSNIQFQFTVEYTAEEIVFPTDYVEK